MDFLGKMVYLKHDPAQKHYLVYEKVIKIDGSLLYGLCCGTENVIAFPQELTENKNWGAEDNA